MTEEHEELNLDRLRREFATRIQYLIDAMPGNKKQIDFAIKARTSTRQLSQWANPKQVNWPSARTICELCYWADISPTWLLFGIGPDRLSVAKAQHLNDTKKLAAGVVSSVRASVPGLKGDGSPSKANVEMGKGETETRTEGPVPARRTNTRQK